MSMDAEAGGGLELGDFSLKALIGVQAAFDGVLQHLKKIEQEENEYQYGAVEVPFRFSSVSGASGNLVIDLGGPSYNRLWEVKRLTVGGPLWTSTVAGTALVLKGPASGQITPSLTDTCDQAATLPSVAFYGTRQLVVRHPSHLFVVILSPSATTQYAVGGEAVSFPDKRLPIRVSD